MYAVQERRSQKFMLSAQHERMGGPAMETRYISTGLHGVTSLKTAIFIVIAGRTTNPLKCLTHYPQDFGTQVL
jgi:hypothetical protein